MSDIHFFSSNEILKRELEEKERNLLLAAQYGKGLLDQNAELHTKIERVIQECDNKVENLQQERYSLFMKLEAKERVIKTLSTEIEIQEKLQNENIKEVTNKFEEELGRLNRKVSSHEATIESLKKESAIYKEKSDDFEVLLEQIQQQQHETSCSVAPEGNFDDYVLQLENQISSHKNEKQDFEKLILELKVALKTTRLNLKNKETDMERTVSELEEKECRLTSMFNEIERTKKENEELRVEIDQMKFAETDPRKKGNSLFAELEDNRQALEKQVLSLSSKFATVKKQCEIKSQQVAKLKLHIASLVNMTTSGEDLQYQKHLEDSLVYTKSQLDTFVSRCREFEKELKKPSVLSSNYEMDASDKIGNGNFLKHLYEESLTKAASLEEELRSMYFTKVSLNDQILQLRRKLHQSEKERNANKAEIIRLSVKLEELMGCNESIQGNVETVKEEDVVVLIEKLPTFEGSKQEASEERRSKQNLREQFITLETKWKSPSDDLNIQSVLTPKENKSPDSERKRFEKRVNFTVAETKEIKKPAEKNVHATKPRRKMEAPHIKVTQDSQPTECKVQ